MNISEWQQSNNAYEMLEFMKEHDKVAFSRKAIKVHLYLIKCAKQYLKFRSNIITKNGLDSAEKHLKKLIKIKEFHQQEWLVEGQAFSVDIGLNESYPYPYAVDLNQHKDLKMIRISSGLFGKQAKQYLMDLAYFIDKCMAYSRDSAGELPSKEYAKFMSATLLRRKFNFPITTK
jgi:hypothetical protein